MHSRLAVVEHGPGRYAADHEHMIAGVHAAHRQAWRRPVAGRDGAEQRYPLGTDRQPVRGVLDVAAGEGGSGAGEESGADAELAVRGISTLGGRPVEYYDFGPTAPNPQDAYRLPDGSLVFSSAPGSASYSGVRIIYDVGGLDQAAPEKFPHDRAQVLELVRTRKARLGWPQAADAGSARCPARA